MTLTLAFAGCRTPVEDLDPIFYDGDARHVHCGANIDDKSPFDTAEILRALDRAGERGEVIELYSHKPGRTVSLERIEAVVAYAAEIGLAFYTYADLAARRSGPGLALSFDDRDVEGWTGLRPLFASYGARVTFFVSGYPYFDDGVRGQLRQLAADGHDIAAHTVDHVNAPSYVEENGLAAFMRAEALPSIALLRADGFTVTSFAYPFGLRTNELDRAILQHVDIVRGTESSWGEELLSSCP